MGKSPKEQGIEELNKKLGKEIAKRMLEIKKHQAEIKKLEKEIEKIENGELVPDCEDESRYTPIKNNPLKSVIAPFPNANKIKYWTTTSTGGKYK